MAKEHNTIVRRAKRGALNFIRHVRPVQRADITTSGNRLELRIGSRMRYFEFKHRLPAYQTFDFAVFALAAIAMPRGLRLRFDLPVSESAALAVARVATVLKERARHIVSPLDLELTCIVPDRPTREGKILCLSGGVDSTYCAAMHAEYKQALTIRGFDLSLEDEAAYQPRRFAAARVAERFDLKIIDLTTDLSKSLRYFEVFNALYFTSCLSLAGYGLEGGALSVDNTRESQLLAPHYGLTTGIDAHLSTSSFRIKLLGDNATRAEKICAIRDIAPELLDSLGFCSGSPKDGGNCGLCAKCMQTRLCLVQKNIPQEMIFKNAIDPIQYFEKLQHRDRLEAGFTLGRLDEAIADMPEGNERSALIDTTRKLRFKFFGIKVQV